MRNDILHKKDIVLKWIGESRSKSWICSELKCKSDTLESYLKKWGIEYKGNRGLLGYKNAPKTRKSAIEYAKKTSITTSKLRKKLIEDNIKQEKCEMCGIDSWMDKKIPLELHHVDGNRFNNDISNLQILCPNCHSLTPNHSKKQKASVAEW